LGVFDDETAKPVKGHVVVGNPYWRRELKIRSGYVLLIDVVASHQVLNGGIVDNVRNEDALHLCGRC
jgi:hypothetical protein